MRIADNALVAAAKLSSRYIQDRFMPDKAIDLVDEAASKLRMQQESKPDAIDMLERELIRKQIEIEGKAVSHPPTCLCLLYPSMFAPSPPTHPPTHPPTQRSNARRTKPPSSA